MEKLAGRRHCRRSADLLCIALHAGGPVGKRVSRTQRTQKRRQQLYAGNHHHLVSTAAQSLGELVDELLRQVPTHVGGVLLGRNTQPLCDGGTGIPRHRSRHLRHLIEEKRHVDHRIHGTNDLLRPGIRQRLRRYRLQRVHGRAASIPILPGLLRYTDEDYLLRRVHRFSKSKKLGLIAQADGPRTDARAGKHQWASPRRHKVSTWLPDSTGPHTANPSCEKT